MVDQQLLFRNKQQHLLIINNNNNRYWTDNNRIHNEVILLGFEELLMNYFLIGMLIGITLGLRYLVMLNRRMLLMEKNIKKILVKLEIEEEEVLENEKRIFKKLRNKK